MRMSIPKTLDQFRESMKSNPHSREHYQENGLPDPRGAI